MQFNIIKNDHCVLTANNTKNQKRIAEMNIKPKIVSLSYQKAFDLQEIKNRHICKRDQTILGI